jgi:hypothetical protein
MFATQLRVAYHDLSDLERIHTDILMKLPGVVRTQSTLVLRTVKKTTSQGVTVFQSREMRDFHLRQAVFFKTLLFSRHGKKHTVSYAIYLPKSFICAVSLVNFVTRPF